MALGRNLEESLQKAVRSLEIDEDDLISETCRQASDEEVENRLVNAQDDRIFYLAEAFRRGYSLEEVHELTKIDRYFLVVIGSGPIRIGQGVEFDYATVHCVKALQKLGYEAIVMNSNPETVSTDFSVSDKLYFEPLTLEDVLNVIDLEQPEGVILQFGGQTAINLAAGLDAHGVRVLGTTVKDLDRAEDRELFDQAIKKLGLKQPQGDTI